ncbi:MAG: hypothetical protein FWG10_00910 [Eubacteriaceae bacterium]|nr:hypothetical protein [Eubacteriaceae bacterium]
MQKKGLAMKQNLIFFLCAAIVMIGLLSACGRVEKSNGSPGQPDAPPTGSYWKAVEFIGEGASDEFWSDLFLWEDGSGYLRVSQATQESNYWGMRDVSGCDWTDNGGTLTLTQPAPLSDVICTGVFEEGRLTIEYKGFWGNGPLTIVMEQAQMPPYGAQWELPELYGTWRMASYADSSGTILANGPDGGFGSEIIVHPTGSVDIKLVDNDLGEMEHNMLIGGGKPDSSIDDDGEAKWYLYQSGPIWEGCKNEAWHIELSYYDDPQDQGQLWFITYDGGRLLLNKTSGGGIDAWPSAFRAEFEYAGNVSEYDFLETANSKKLGYNRLIALYQDLASTRGEAWDAAERLSGIIAEELDIDDEQRLYELNCSLFEMQGSFGYAIHDVNSDGIPELFLLSENNYDIHAVYTLVDSKPALVGAYWSRNRCAIDKDGVIYVSGSNGADDSFSASWSLVQGSSELQLVQVFDGAYPVYPDNPTKDAGLDFIPLK